jgi:polyphosphate kinase
LPPNSPKILPPFSNGESVFGVIERGDVLLFHPYESFDPMTRMIKEAAKDPKVISIRMTLYRVEQRSQIIQALIDAASEGKQVTVMVELKARFDEENNLHWAKALENAGAHVIYGITGFKVHAKVTQIIRQIDGKLKFYMHFGTGNYNASTAKIYTDVSFFTCKEEFAKDSTAFFHILSGFSKNRKLNTLAMSPMQIKNRIIAMINHEATKGQDGYIIAKMNSLVDPDVIKALYYASSQGVKIQLIIRGICCLRPGVEGVSESIEVKSIIGKYLEHARIFYFKNSEPQMYISSADWMPRNLERRLELMTPIVEQSLVQKLYEVLQLQLNDNQLSWELGVDGEYTKPNISQDAKAINNHQILEDYINRIYKTIKKDATSSKVNQLSRKLFKES